MKLKIMSLVLALMMTATLFAACGGGTTSSTADSSSASTESTESKTEESSSAAETPAGPVDRTEPVELVWYQWDKAHNDDETVYTKLNEMSKAAINTTVDFRYADDEKAKLIVSTDEYYDMIFTCSWQNNYLQQAPKGVFADITEALPKYAPDLYKYCPEVVWQGAQVNGKIYMIPVYKDNAAANYWVTDKSMLADAGITDADLATLGDDPATMTPIMKKIVDSGITLENNVSAPFMINSSGVNFYGHGFDYITRSAANIVCPLDSTDNKVGWIFDQPKAISAVKTVKEWRDLGYVNADAATQEETAAYTPIGVSQGWPGCEAIWKNAIGGEVVITMKSPAFYATDTVIGSGHAIYANSKHIDRSLDYLQYCNLNSEYRNIFAYGIEGNHWNKTADGTAERTENGINNYRPGAFAQATFFTMLPEAPAPATMYTDLQKICESAAVSPLLGFTADFGEMSTEMAALESIWTKYGRSVVTGDMKDVDAELKAIKAEMDEAGLQKVIDTVQTQIDAFVAAKK